MEHVPTWDRSDDRGRLNVLGADPAQICPTGYCDGGAAIQLTNVWRFVDAVVIVVGKVADVGLIVGPGRTEREKIRNLGVEP
jgi:hypothetical protein